MKYQPFMPAFFLDYMKFKGEHAGHSLKLRKTAIEIREVWRTTNQNIYQNVDILNTTGVNYLKYIYKSSSL